MANDFAKFEKELADLRARLGRHKLAPHFTGSNLSLGGEPLPETIEIEDISVPPTLFSGLFLLPDDARCILEVEREQTPDKAPPGIYVKSRHEWIEHYNRVGLYRIQSTDRSESKGVFIDHVFYDETKSPPQVGTLSFARLAVAAYEMGFDEITLLAGGGAGSHAAEWNPPTMVGYKVWPKFGFDAPLEEGETAAIGHLASCRTVSQIRQVDLDWWETKGGNGRVMRFDLQPNSESWQVLLAYIRSRKEFE